MTPKVYGCAFQFNAADILGACFTTPQAIMIIGLIAYAFPPEKTDARPFNRSNDFRSDIAVHNTGKCGVP
jgi:hypothetical protein